MYPNSLVQHDQSSYESHHRQMTQPRHFHPQNMRRHSYHHSQQQHYPHEHSSDHSAYHVQDQSSYNSRPGTIDVMLSAKQKKHRFRKPFPKRHHQHNNSPNKHFNLVKGSPPVWQKKDNMPKKMVNNTSPLNKVLFKTALCRHFLNGFCNRGEKCNFAHGKHEMLAVSSAVAAQSKAAASRSSSLWHFDASELDNDNVATQYNLGGLLAGTNLFQGVASDSHSIQSSNQSNQSNQSSDSIANGVEVIDSRLPPLPPSWTRVKDDRGADGYYYWNEVTDEVTWKIPSFPDQSHQNQSDLSVATHQISLEQSKSSLSQQCEGIQDINTPSTSNQNKTTSQNNTVLSEQHANLSGRTSPIQSNTNPSTLPGTDEMKPSTTIHDEWPRKNSTPIKATIKSSSSSNSLDSMSTLTTSVNTMEPIQKSNIANTEDIPSVVGSPVRLSPAFSSPNPSPSSTNNILEVTPEEKAWVLTNLPTSGLMTAATVRAIVDAGMRQA